MNEMEKRIFIYPQTTGGVQGLKDYLETKGFTFEAIPNSSNKRMFYAAAGMDTDCYWIVKNGYSQYNFMTSIGEEAFRNYATINSTHAIGCIYMPLTNNGCILYLTTLPIDASVGDLELNCKNEFMYDESDPPQIVPNPDQLLHNGLVAITPAEHDNRWRYSWRDKSIDDFYWDVDTGKGVYEYGDNVSQIPTVKMHQAEQCVSLTKAALQNGGWSNYIRVLVLGTINPPTAIFKINGQKFIAITDNTTKRCPVFKLPAEQLQHNISTTTDEYSTIRTYLVGDYCIHDNILYKCIQAIQDPMPFDPDYWTQTTVHNEIVSQTIYTDLGG